MEFTDELLNRLADEGICWTREEDGTLSYMSAYEHALAEVYPKDRCFVIKNECRDASDDGTLVDRTFGDCTNAPRAGLISGCYPLDECYKSRPEAKMLAELKKAAKSKQ